MGNGRLILKWGLEAGFENAGLMRLPQEGTRVYGISVYTKVGDLTVWPAVGVLTVVCAVWSSADNKIQGYRKRWTGFETAIT